MSSEQWIPDEKWLAAAEQGWANKLQSVADLLVVAEAELVVRLEQYRISAEGGSV